MRRHYFDVQRWFFGVFAVTTVFQRWIPVVSIPGWAAPALAYYAIPVGLIALAAVRNERVHAVAAVLVLVFGTDVVRWF